MITIQEFTPEKRIEKKDYTIIINRGGYGYVIARRIEDALRQENKQLNKQRK